MKWIGLDQFRERLLDLPAHLTDQAEPIVLAAAQHAQSVAQAQYPEQSKTIYGTGNLRNGLRIDVLDRGRNGVRVRLRNNAPHAYIYEIGSAVRRTGRGWNRGSMPAAHVFVPASMRAREAMYHRLAEMLERVGFVVRAA